MGLGAPILILKGTGAIGFRLAVLALVLWNVVTLVLFSGFTLTLLFLWAHGGSFAVDFQGTLLAFAIIGGWIGWFSLVIAAITAADNKLQNLSWRVWAGISVGACSLVYFNAYAFRDLIRDSDSALSVFRYFAVMAGGAPTVAALWLALKNLQINRQLT